MNTKVEEALAHVGQAAEALDYAGANQRGIELVRAARATLSAHIAQQDATIARMFTREQAAELMRGMVPDMATMSTHGTNATCNGHDACRTETLARIEAWQNQEQGK